MYVITSPGLSQPQSSGTVTSMIDEVVNPMVVDPTPVFTPVKSTLPIPFVPIPDKSVLKSIFNTLIS